MNNQRTAPLRRTLLMVSVCLCPLPSVAQDLPLPPEALAEEPYVATYSNLSLFGLRRPEPRPYNRAYRPRARPDDLGTDFYGPQRPEDLAQAQIAAAPVLDAPIEEASPPVVIEAPKALPSAAPTMHIETPAPLEPENVATPPGASALFADANPEPQALPDAPLETASAVRLEDVSPEAVVQAPPPLAVLAPPPPPPLAAPQKLEILATKNLKRGAFFDSRAPLLEQFLSATTAEEEIDAALNLAHLHIAQMLLPEARDFLRRAELAGVHTHPDFAARWQALTVQSEILSLKPVSDLAKWELSPLWQSLADELSGQPTQADLAEAMTELQLQSPAVLEVIVPPLFDAFLRANKLQLADSLLRGAREMTGLARTPSMNLMLGRLALAYDMPQEAFDAFVRASRGSDIYAQRARIALADIAIARQKKDLLPALADILNEGVNQWRHGHEALILRARLARVAEDLGDIPLALDIMGKIRLDHPGTPEAILAHERGALALAAFAVAVEAEEIDLSTYLASLRQVEAFYRLDPVWPIARTALARAWAKAGLNVAAASEMEALQLDLQRIGAPTPHHQQAVLMAIEEAEHWLANQDLARARIALAREGLPEFSHYTERYTLAALQAQSLGAYGLAMEFSTPEAWHTAARAARMAGLYAPAEDLYRTLAAQGEIAEDVPEAIQALRLSYEAGSDDLGAEIFAQLQTHPSAITPELHRAISLPLPALTPLARTTADEMLARTDAALAATLPILTRPLLDSAPSLSASQE